MDKVMFGEVNSEHMLEINYKEASGWSDPVIKPF